jgi:hypothetical protein
MDLAGGGAVMYAPSPEAGANVATVRGLAALQRAVVPMWTVARIGLSRGSNASGSCVP